LDIEQIINDLKSERDRLDSAIAALQGGSSTPSRRAPGRNARPLSAESKEAPVRRRRTLSIAARARIAAAQKARWAKIKAQKKK
jgi:hypothetical protein